MVPVAVSRFTLRNTIHERVIHLNFYGNTVPYCTLVCDMARFFRRPSNKSYRLSVWIVLCGKVRTRDKISDTLQYKIKYHFSKLVTANNFAADVVTCIQRTGEHGARTGLTDLWGN